jgi:hypothetical protein
MGYQIDAKDFFQQARELNPKYNDAILNAKAQYPKDLLFTKHPLRSHPSRMEYDN